jgi:hypothetical protein
MDAALNQSGTLTWAGSATYGGAYRCPRCKVRVIYASGSIQSPHFRHKPRTPAEDERAQSCPLYIADHGGSTGVGPAIPPRRPPGLRPRLALTWTRPARGPELWALVVAVPTPPQRVSFVRVEENINGGVDVSREAVLRSRQVWVRAAARSYQVIGYDASRGAVWSPQQTEALAADVPNFFRSGANGGLQLLPDEPLVKGATYVALCRAAGWSSPPGNLSRPVERFPLTDPRREWKCHLVHFPPDAPAGVSAWCERVCRRELVDPPPELSLVLPPAVTVWPDGTYRLRAGEEVVLALHGGDWIDPVLEVVNEGTSESQEWRLSVESGDFISLGKLPAGTYTVHVRDWEWVSLTIEMVKADVPAIPGVVLKSAATVDGGETLTAILDHEAGDSWGAILSGREVWRGIELPDGWPVALSWKAKGAEQTASNLDTPEAVAGAIAECLGAHPSAASLDAGVFGAVEWAKPDSGPAAKAAPIALPAALLSRLRWLQLARDQAGAATISPLCLTAPRGWSVRIAEPDRPLVAEFLTTRDWPLTLLAHARGAGAELFRLMRGAP